MKNALLLPLAAFAAALGLSQSLTLPQPEARRVEVLFLGAPLENGPGHNPIERYRVIKKELGDDGINFTYAENLDVLDRSVLDQFDALLLYGNWEQNGTLAPERLAALTGYIEDGGAFLPIHCASACFGASEEFVKLVGARFQSHGDGVFTTTIVAPDHPLMQGFQGFETWDETYVHDRHNDDRTVLQVREDEPWTWVREQGKGRVFYTAYGHDLRCWGNEGFHELLRRAILWSVGDEVSGKLAALDLPELEMEEMLLPGYRQKAKITEGQKPLPAAESMKMAQVPVGFELSLFASEPDIVNPIHVSWDHRGRAFVIETVDYPNNLQSGDLGHDKIKICEDTNGDGRADRFTVFADKLSVPTTLVFANGGVICTNGSDVLFLKDTDGDDVADVREVLFTGFGMGDTHAGPSNFRYGHDNWIYATVGYSGFNGTVGSESHRFSSGVFRFKPDGSKLEYLQATTNNTWGLGLTDDFDVIGSTANANPSWYLSFPRAFYDAAGLEQPRTPRADDNPKFFPSSTDIRQVDVFDGYTSAAGHAFYTSDRFPAEYRDRIAFICEPTGKLVGQFEVERTGAGFTARQLPNNLYNSADGWSGPVHAETGPDGAVWVADWYNIIIQHNPTPNVNSAGYDAKTGRGNAYETPLRDTRHGRIYRIYPQGTTDDENPGLDPARPETLIAALDHPNQLWRLHAQRLLVETRATGQVEALRKLVADGAAEGKRSALHAFHALHGLGALDLESITAALASTNRGLRRAGIANAPLDETLAAASIRDGSVQAPDDRELAETLVGLTRLAPSDAIGAAIFRTLKARTEAVFNDATLLDAWQMAARRHAPGVILSAADDKDASETKEPENLLPNPDFSETNGHQPAHWTFRSWGEAKPGTASLSIVPDGRSGNAIRIQSEDNPADVAASATVQVKPNTRYRLGAWIRTENVRNHGGRGAMLNVHEFQNAASKAVHGTTGWTEISVDFNSGNRSEIEVLCLFGGYGRSSGTAWWDDVYLHEIDAGDLGGTIRELARHFAAHGDPAARGELLIALKEKAGDSSSLVEILEAAPETEPAAERKFEPDPAVHERGLEVYNRTCIACHGPDGKGVAGAFPPLDGVDLVTGDPSIPARIILHGLQGPIEVAGQRYENIMPPLVDLEDQEIADVLTYVRQNWSNDAAPVTADEVKAVREKFASRTTPWTAEELR